MAICDTKLRFLPSAPARRWRVPDGRLSSTLRRSALKAATDPLRSSARNRADRLVAHNVRAEFAGRPLRSYRAPNRRWGSVLGVQPDGLEVFAPNGRAFRFPAWSIDSVLQPWIVRRGIYRGVRASTSDEARKTWLVP